MEFEAAVNQATDNRALQRIARAGYLISGMLHLLLASIIVRIALGSSGEADQTGALAMWRLSESVLGLHPAEHSDAHKRDSPITVSTVWR